MARSTFTQEEIAYLYSLPAVSRVVNGRISYSDVFKRECVRQYLLGRSPARVFREAGLDPQLIGYKRIERCMARWRERYGDAVRASLPEDPEARADAVEQSRSFFAGGGEPFTVDADEVKATVAAAPASVTAEQLIHKAAAQQSMANIMFGQQMRHIEELEGANARLRARVEQLGKRLEHEAYRAATGTIPIERQDEREARTYEVYIVERDQNGTVTDIHMFLSENEHNPYLGYGTQPPVGNTGEAATLDDHEQTS